MANGTRPTTSLPDVTDEADVTTPAAPVRPAVVRPPTPPARRGITTPTAAAAARRRLAPRR